MHILKNWYSSVDFSADPSGLIASLSQSPPLGSADKSHYLGMTKHDKSNEEIKIRGCMIANWIPFVIWSFISS